MNQTPQEYYQSNISKYTLEVEKLAKQTRRISAMRLFIFVLTIFFVYWFSQQNLVGGLILSILAGISLFLYLVKYHSKVINLRNQAQALLKINEDELRVLNHDFSHLPSGAEFIDPAHQYASDIDIFGKGSIFQYINRTATIPGKKTLADRLMKPLLSKSEILDNQQAVGELQFLLDFRQRYQTLGLLYDENDGDDRKIRKWASKPPVFNHPFYRFAIYIVPFITIGMIILLSVGLINFQQFILWLVVPWGIAAFSAKRTNERHSLVSKTGELLEKYANMLNEIETTQFTSDQLNRLKNKLKTNEISAGKSIKKLKSILSALDNRLNFVSWALLNGLLLWDILQMSRLESWQRNYQNKIDDWFDVIKEYDVLNSFGNFMYNNPLAHFPEVTEEEFKIIAEDLGHPLIPEKERVNNDLNIKQGEFTIITGANMAGKSTYLRTIGTNLILAMCGAPVIAKSFKFKPVELYTSIRTTDSLFKNESYFYAELKRLSRIIEELRNGKDMFIILDEILKGTNSKDKHKGSEALLRQFITYKATGIVATHDVSLGVLEQLFPEHIKNRCFEVDIRGSELKFDYKLRHGISQNMNATLLMKKMGITV